MKHLSWFVLCVSLIGCGGGGGDSVSASDENALAPNASTVTLRWGQSDWDNTVWQ